MITLTKRIDRSNGVGVCVSVVVVVVVVGGGGGDGGGVVFFLLGVSPRCGQAITSRGV